MYALVIVIRLKTYRSGTYLPIFKESRIESRIDSSDHTEPANSFLEAETEFFKPFFEADHIKCYY